MLCDKCKSKEAHVFIERTINGEKEKFALCSECAATMEKELPFSIDIGSFFSGFNPFGSAAMHQAKVSPKCSCCGMSFDDFEKKGRLGCGHCYEDFREQLVPVIRRIHGSQQHTGYMSSEEDKKRLAIQELKAKLSEAILQENFEEAAVLRDEIKALEEVKKNDSVD